MKRHVYILLAMLASSLCLAKAVDYEKLGDSFAAQKNSVTDTAQACVIIDMAIENYKKALDLGTSPGLLVKYVDAEDFKNSTLNCDKAKAWEANQAVFAMVDNYCHGNTACAESAAINYCYLVLWGRYGDMASGMESFQNGVADKIKYYGEKLHSIDKTYGGWTASLILGRLHFMAPNIVFVLTWPDKNKSREYLEEFVKANPSDLMGKFFLADTLWDAGDKDRPRAAVLFKETANAKPSKEGYFWEINTIKDCRARMKELGIGE